MEYQICNRCVMDNFDSTIKFDENGICNYCTEALARLPDTYFPNEIGEKKFQEMIDMLKNQGKGKDYDCLMGISGGLDSAYLAYIGSKAGLRILAVHIDDGYDTEISKQNIKKLGEYCNLNIINCKPDETQFNNLTKAFFRAEVPDIAIPQDNVLFSYLYKIARKHKIKYFLSGGNFALECILQQGNTHDAYDLVNIKNINRKFGNNKIDKLPLMSTFKKNIYSKILGIKTLRPLNYIDYNKERAIKELKDNVGFDYYGGKHYESALTRMIQGLWFPEKFSVDKRKSHLSSMIVSGQITREDALEMLQKPIYDSIEMEQDIALILKKLDITREEFNDNLSRKGKQHTEYKTSKLNKLFNFIRGIRDRKYKKANI